MKRFSFILLLGYFLICCQICIGQDTIKIKKQIDSLKTAQANLEKQLNFIKNSPFKDIYIAVFDYEDMYGNIIRAGERVKVVSRPSAQYSYVNTATYKNINIPNWYLKTESEYPIYIKKMADYAKSKLTLQKGQLKTDSLAKIAKINKLKKQGAFVYCGTPGSTGNIDINITWINKLEKNIKYTRFTLVPYNRENNICLTDNNASIVVEAVGPFDKGVFNNIWYSVWHNSTISYCKIIKISFEYMDGIKKDIIVNIKSIDFVNYFN